MNMSGILESSFSFFFHASILFSTFRNLEFEQAQEAHQQSQMRTLRSAHHSIVEFMTLIYTIFSKGGPEVWT